MKKTEKDGLIIQVLMKYYVEDENDYRTLEI